MIDKELISWTFLRSPKVKKVLATADYPATSCKFELFELEDGNYACYFFAYDSAGGWQSKYFDKVYDQWREWCDGEEKHIRDRNGDPVCAKCRHKEYSHNQPVAAWFDGKPGNYCLVNMGMGDPCGCEEYVEV